MSRILIELSAISFSATLNFAALSVSRPLVFLQVSAASAFSLPGIVRTTLGYCGKIRRSVRFLCTDNSYRVGRGQLRCLRQSGFFMCINTFLHKTVLNRFSQIIGLLKFRLAFDITYIHVSSCQNMTEVFPSEMFHKMIIVKYGVSKTIAFCRH